MRKLYHYSKKGFLGGVFYGMGLHTNINPIITHSWSFRRYSWRRSDRHRCRRRAVGVPFLASSRRREERHPLRRFVAVFVAVLSQRHGRSHGHAHGVFSRRRGRGRGRGRRSFPRRSSASFLVIVVARGNV